MAFSIYTDVGDGITTNFDFTFPYLEQDDIFIFLDDVEQIRFYDYTILDSVVTFMVPPALDVAIKIQRTTPVDALEATFTNTSILDADQLNISNLQQLYKLQEITDLLNQNINSFAGNNTMNQNLNMNNYRIINVEDAVSNGDALNYGQAQALINSFEEPILEYIVNGEGYEIAQTTLSGYDLTLNTEGGIEWISRNALSQILKSSYTEFDTITAGAYDIGGGILELPAIDSPDINQAFYTRIK